MNQDELMEEGLRDWQADHSKSFQKADFDVVNDPKKGRCVLALRPFSIGEFVMEYEGNFMTREEMDVEDKKYDIEGLGCFYIHCTWKDEKKAIDGTLKLDSLGRLVNHQRGGNLKPFRLLQPDKEQLPRMALQCARPIEAGDELYWDYGIGTEEAAWASTSRAR